MPVHPQRKSRGVAKKHYLHSTWSNMRTRCNNKNHHAYHRYGGRGISVCAEWDSFWRFVDDMESRCGVKPDGMTLDRIDGDLGYYPENCKWATRKEQASHFGGKSENKSGYLCVNWHEVSNKWWASVMISGESHYLGLFECVHDAGRAVAEREGREFKYNPKAGKSK